MTRMHIRTLGRQRGLSLVELMIGMALGLVLLTALASLYVSTSQSRAQLNNSANQIENGRYALDQLTQELRLAGFMGTSNLMSTAVVSAPAVCAVATNLLGFSASGPNVPQAVYGYVPPAQANVSCLPNWVPNSEILVVRRVSTTVTATVVGGQAYMQVSACQGDGVPFVFSSTATDFVVHDKTCSTLAPIRQVSVRVFYLANCDICSGNGDGVPTLKVAEFSAGGFVSNSIAQGIQDVHFSYGVDLDSNGSADCYVSDPGVDNSAFCAGTTYNWATPLTNWSNVTAVRINLLARTLSVAPGWVDKRTYDLGRGTQTGPFNDGYKRHVYAQVARLDNVAGPRE